MANQCCCNTVTIPPVFNKFNTCDDGMDVIIAIDYSGSMGGEISTVYQGVQDLVSTITNISDANYRLALCTFNTDNNNPTSKSDPAVVRVSPTYGGNRCYLELDTNNDTEFINMVQYIGTSVGGGSERADLILRDVLQNNFAGTLRTDVPKFLVIVSDESARDQGLTLSNFTNEAILKDFRVIVLGRPASDSQWQNICTATGGGFTSNINPNSIASLLVQSCTS